MLPSTLLKESICKSNITGWAWHVSPNEFTDMSLEMASTDSPIVSPAFGPIICVPNNFPSFFPERIFMYPWVSPKNKLN